MRFLLPEPRTLGGAVVVELPIPAAVVAGQIYVQVVGASGCGPMGLAATAGLSVPITAR